MQSDPYARPTWKVGNIIRHKATGHPYQVIHIFKFSTATEPSPGSATVLIDLNDRSELPISFTLLPRNYDDYAVERDMELKKDSITWQYNSISL